MTVKSILNWFGGKYKLLEHILPFPVHKGYCEPFAGSLVVLFNKVRSQVEVVNDINTRLANLWRVIQQVGYKLDEFKLRCKWFGNLNARQFFEEYKVPSEDEITDAMRMFWVNCHSFSGINTTFGGFTTKGSGAKQDEWENKVNEVDRISRRLRGVIIENQDFRRILSRCDREDFCIYVDPPYFNGGETYEGMVGGHKWSDGDFEDLREILWKMEKPRIIISIDDPRYFTNDGWFVEEVKRTNTAGVRVGEGSRRVLSEYIIRNFDNSKVLKMRAKDQLKHKSFMGL